MKKTIAMYIRLSLEDNDLKSSSDKKESNSIGNQRNLITKYIRESRELSDYEINEYLDDGFTGTNFEREGFQKLIASCRKGNVQCIIVKDFSRLGRDYVEVGNLLEQLFPFLGVRVISINDGYDSNTFVGQTGGIDVAFKNLVYNLYSRDLSHKVKSAVTSRMKKGEYQSPYGIYGYKKDPEDIHKLVIDDEAAGVVRRIFDMVIAGTPRGQIAKKLNDENVLTPALYKRKKGCTRDWAPDGKKAGWSNSMIAKIIRDERYAGNMVAHKKVYKAFGSKHQIEVDKSEWIVVENTHEGIVSHDEFEAANANMQVRHQPKKDKVSSGKNYSVITCPYCGLRLRPGKEEYRYMYCATGRTHSESPCSKVRIEKELVQNVLIKLVRNQAEIMISAEEIIKKKTQSKSAKNNTATLIKGLKAEKKRLEASKVSEYERYKLGSISRNEFSEAKKTVDTRIADIEKELSNLTVTLPEKALNEESDIWDIKKYVHLEKYDKEVMAALIEKAIVVDENTVEVVWKNQDMYDKLLAQI
jgi:DNA invertase Pin-like site-specific DNA recombinase